jgi:tubulin delta
MSVFLLIGQCGIQLGTTVIEDLAAQALVKGGPRTKLLHQFFHVNPKGDGRPIANALLIDMEQKVVEGAFAATKNSLFAFSTKLSFTKQEGSGNNWAYGFNVHGLSCRQALLDAFAQIYEAIGDLDTVIIIQSVAGGTGSGLGSFILSHLSELYPELAFINFLVVPKLSGEVILQYYNAIFSLTMVNQHSNGIFLLENDKADLICKTVLKMGSVNLDSMNFVLSKFVCSALLADNGSDSGFFEAWEAVLLPLPSCKLLGCRFVPIVSENLKSFSTDTWKGLVSRAQQLLVSGSTEGNINWSLKLPERSPDWVRSGSHSEKQGPQPPRELTRSQPVRSQPRRLPRVCRSIW